MILSCILFILPAIYICLQGFKGAA